MMGYAEGPAGAFFPRFSFIRTIPSAPEFHRFSQPLMYSSQVAGYTAGRESSINIKLLLLMNSPDPENLYRKLLKTSVFRS
jgi:hypothetical protein